MVAAVGSMWWLIVPAAADAAAVVGLVVLANLLVDGEHGGDAGFGCTGEVLVVLVVSCSSDMQDMRAW